MNSKKILVFASLFLFLMLLILPAASAYSAEKDINKDGKISFNEWLKGFFTGQQIAPTTTYNFVNNVDLTFSVAKSGSGGLSFNLNPKSSLNDVNLENGVYIFSAMGSIAEGGRVVFNVNDGVITITEDAANSVVSGNTLTLNGVSVIVDNNADVTSGLRNEPIGFSPHSTGRQLTLISFTTSAPFIGYFTTGGYFDFTVGADGSIFVDRTAYPFVSAQGNRLSIDGYPLTIINNLSSQVYLRNEEYTVQPGETKSAKLVWGRTKMQGLAIPASSRYPSGESFEFEVNLDGTFSIDTAIYPFLSLLDSGKTLVISAPTLAPATFSVTNNLDVGAIISADAIINPGLITPINIDSGATSSGLSLPDGSYLVTSAISSSYISGGNFAFTVLDGVISENVPYATSAGSSLTIDGWSMRFQNTGLVSTLRGIQHSNIADTAPNSISLEVKILPGYLGGSLLLPSYIAGGNFNYFLRENGEIDITPFAASQDTFVTVSGNTLIVTGKPINFRNQASATARFFAFIGSADTAPNSISGPFGVIPGTFLAGFLSPVDGLPSSFTYTVNKDGHFSATNLPEGTFSGLGTSTFTVNLPTPACGVACQIEEALDQNGSGLAVVIPDESKWQIVSAVAGSSYVEVSGSQNAEMTIVSSTGTSKIKNSFNSTIQGTIRKISGNINGMIVPEQISYKVNPIISDLNAVAHWFNSQPGSNFDSNIEDDGSGNPAMFIANSGSPIPTMIVYCDNGSGGMDEVGELPDGASMSSGCIGVSSAAVGVTKDINLINAVGLTSGSSMKWVPNAVGGQTIESRVGAFDMTSIISRFKILETSFAQSDKVQFAREGPAYKSVMSALTGSVNIRDLTVPSISEYVSLAQNEKIGLSAQRIGNIVSIEKRSSSKERLALVGKLNEDAGYSNFVSSSISEIQNIYEFQVGAFGTPETITPIEFSLRPTSDFVSIKQDFISGLQIKDSSLVEPIVTSKIVATDSQQLISGKSVNIQTSFIDTLDSNEDDFIYGISSSPLSVIVVEESKVESVKRNLENLNILSVSVESYRAEKDTINKRITHVFRTPKLGTIALYKADMSDGDSDSVPALFDKCLNQAGANADGCPAQIRVSVEEVVAGSKRMDSALETKVFNIVDGNVNGILVQPQNYAQIFATQAENIQAETNSQVVGNSPQNLVSDLVSIGVTVGDKLIIVRSQQSVDGSYGYLGFQVPGLVAGQSRDIGFNIVSGQPNNFVQTTYFTQNSKGIWQSERRAQVIKGSELQVFQPDEVVWNGATQIYPFLFISDSDWNVDVCLEAPEGYQIIAPNTCSQTFVNNEAKVLEFEIKDIGSPKEFNVNYNMDFTHKGKKQSFNSEIESHNPKAKRHFFKNLFKNFKKK